MSNGDPRPRAEFASSSSAQDALAEIFGAALTAPDPAPEPNSAATASKGETPTGASLEAPPADPPVEVASAEAAREVPPTDGSAEEVSPLEASRDETPLDQAARDEVSPDEASPLEASPGQPSSPDTSPEQASLEQTAPLEPFPEQASSLEPPAPAAAELESTALESPPVAPREAASDPEAPTADAVAETAVPPRALPPLGPFGTTETPAKAASSAIADDDAEESEWDLADDLVPGTGKAEPAEAIAPAPPLDRPWRDVDDLEDDEDSEELTGIVHKDEPAEAASTTAPASRRWRDVDDLEDDDEDDPSQYLPTRVMGVPAPTISQRALVPPPPSSRSAVRSHGPGSLPAIPPPPTLPRSVPPSVPPVAFDWLRERTGGRAGSLTVIAAGLALLVVAILPLVVLGAVVAGPVKSLFVSGKGSLVVTVAGPNHTVVESPLFVADDVPRCKQSPCRIADLEPGTHFVRVTAPGYQQMAPRAVAVRDGGEVVLHVELAREPKRVTATDPITQADAIDLDDRSIKLEALPRSRAEHGASSESARAASGTGHAAGAALAAAPAQLGTLNLSSNPPSNVVLDGRPLGVTPRKGIKVKAGGHQVVFVHPKLGRKVARANVKPGAVSNVAVRFR